MRLSVRLMVLAATLIALQASGLHAQGAKLAGYGVVLLHGKGGTPTSMIEGLTESLRKEGAVVEAPELPWSRRRMYDATYDQAMAEIDLAVQKLKWAGATKIVVAGHSLGANAAIGYGARRDGLAAVIALAPGHLAGGVGVAHPHQGRHRTREEARGRRQGRHSGLVSRSRAGPAVFREARRRTSISACSIRKGRR